MNESEQNLNEMYRDGRKFGEHVHKVFDLVDDMRILEQRGLVSAFDWMGIGEDGDEPLREDEKV